MLETGIDFYRRFIQYIIQYIVHSNEVSGFQHCSEYHLLCSTEKGNSNMFVTSRERINDDGTFNFGCTITLKQQQIKS